MEMLSVSLARQVSISVYFSKVIWKGYDTNETIVYFVNVITRQAIYQYVEPFLQFVMCIWFDIFV